MTSLNFFQCQNTLQRNFQKMPSWIHGWSNAIFLASVVVGRCRLSSVVVGCRRSMSSSVDVVFGRCRSRRLWRRQLFCDFVLLRMIWKMPVGGDLRICGNVRRNYNPIITQLLPNLVPNLLPNLVPNYELLVYLQFSREKMNYIN